MLKKKFFGLVAVAMGAGAVLSSCSNEKPGWEYMPDMYRSPALEAYQEYELGEDSISSARKPVEGTVPRGFMAYETMAADDQGYQAAKANLTMPSRIKMDSVAMADAAKLYGIFCSHCHGEKGDGQGVLVEKGKFLGVPSYADRVITPGSIFHVVTYGKGVMGSHASQLTPEERWKVAQYVMDLKATLAGGGEKKEADAAADSTATAKTDSTNTKG